MLSRCDHPVLGEVALSQSRRSTRLSVAVKASGAVRVSFPYGISVRRALEFLEQKIDWVTAARRRQQTLYPPQPLRDPVETRQRIESLRIEAKRDLPPRVARIAAALGLTYGRVTIRASRSKWGSCTSAGNLSLSLFLMTLPEYLRDYVIVHELCHTVHHNHSARFHTLVDKCLCGREKELASELRRFRIAE